MWWFYEFTDIDLLKVHVVENTDLLDVFQTHEWSKNDERLLSAVEHGEVEKVTSLLAKKGASATKLDGEGKSAWVQRESTAVFPLIDLKFEQTDINRDS